jgi:hypothetical protein
MSLSLRRLIPTIARQIHPSTGVRQPTDTPAVQSWSKTPALSQDSAGTATPPCAVLNSTAVPSHDGGQARFAPVMSQNTLDSEPLCTVYDRGFQPRA